ncbi:MAG: SixA phosphatase family protein [Bacteroidia bacterium]
MKKLILVRHAKSDWGNESLKDIDRHLNDRGYEDAYLMAKWFDEQIGVPDLMISSPATRAVSTAFIFARYLGVPESKVLISTGIYESKPETMLDAISKSDDACALVCVFGHNPTLTTLVNDLNKDLMFDNVPTCGVVCIELNINSWKDLAKAKEGKLLVYRFPKSFKQ